MSSPQSSHTRTKCVAVSLAVIASVAATSSTAWGHATPDLFAKVETLTLSDGTPVSGIAAISGNTAVVGHDGVGDCIPPAIRRRPLGAAGHADRER